jgi:hypothetical protein
MLKVKKVTFNFFGALFMDIDAKTGEAKLSLGRFITLVSFIFAMGFWWRNVEIPSSLLTVLMSSMGYVLGSKTLDNVSNIFAGKNANIISQVQAMLPFNKEEDDEPANPQA